MGEPTGSGPGVVCARPFLAAAILLGAGCASDGPGNEPGGGDPSPALVRACEGSCDNQQRLPCPAISDCQGFCEGRGLRYPECEPEWIDLNDCMAEDDLICGYDGSPSTINLTCRELADAFMECVTGVRPPARDEAEDTCTRACLRAAHLECPEDDFIECIERCDAQAADGDCGEPWLELARCLADDADQACSDDGHATTDDAACEALMVAWEACEA